MMDRSMIIGLLGQLPTESLLKALSVAAGGGGDPGAEPDMLRALSMGDDGGAPNKIQSWNDRMVPYKGGGDRPAIADKAWAEGMRGVGQAHNPHMGAIDDDVGESNIFLQTGGGA